MEQTSASLIDRLSSGKEPSAWQTFENLYRPWLLGWLLRCDVQSADAEDILQEVLATVAREIPHFRHNGNNGAFRKWIRNVVVNRLRDFHRKQNRVHLGEDALAARIEDMADEKSQFSLLWDQEHDLHIMNRLLGQVVNDFEPATWRIFEAFVLQEHPASVVAEKFGVSAASVWAAKSRVFKRLREIGKDFLE